MINKKLFNWSNKKVVEALSNEWGSLHPNLVFDTETAYAYKSNRISFNGEINVTLDFVKDKYPSKDFIELAEVLSLSPNPNDLNTHVLNTLNLSMFLSCYPELNGKKLFSISKSNPWDGSHIQISAQYGIRIIEKLLHFESCFHLLLDDEYEIDGVKLDLKRLSLTHHLNQVKAYRLAEIYGHSEKLDEAVMAIERFAMIDNYAKVRLKELRDPNSDKDVNWLYTKELLKKLRA